MTSGGQEEHIGALDFERAVNCLPPAQREVLLLVGASGFSYERRGYNEELRRPRAHATGEGRGQRQGYATAQGAMQGPRLPRASVACRVQRNQWRLGPFKVRRYES